MTFKGIPHALSSILVLLPLLHFINSTPVHASVNDSSTWEPCLKLAAKEVGIPPSLLRAIVDVESNGHPWSFGYRKENGKWASKYLDDQQSAEQFLRDLWQEELHFDAGLAQISRPNLERFWKTMGISPIDALEPCTNLELAAVVLNEQIKKHGYTWRAIAGYNGSIKYIPRVWKAYCQRQPTTDCPRG